MSLTRSLGLAVAGMALLALLVAMPVVAQGEPELDARGWVAFVAKDGPAGPNLPPPDPAYCFPDGGPNSEPPNSVVGALTIGGLPGPGGTLVQLVIGGKLGPAALTTDAGGYRVDYHQGDPGCSNEPGASLGVLVNGQTFTSMATVGSEGATPVLFFAVTVP